MPSPAVSRLVGGGLRRRNVDVIHRKPFKQHIARSHIDLLKNALEDPAQACGDVEGGKIIRKDLVRGQNCRLAIIE